MSSVSTSSNGEVKTSPEQAQTASSGRDSKGRFAAGNKCGTGNPFAGSVAKLRKAALRIVKPQDMEDVFRVLLMRAKTGHLESMKLLFLYTMGKPAPPLPSEHVEDF